MLSLLFLGSVLSNYPSNGGLFIDWILSLRYNNWWKYVRHFILAWWSSFFDRKIFLIVWIEHNQTENPKKLDNWNDNDIIQSLSIRVIIIYLFLFFILLSTRVVNRMLIVRRWESRVLIKSVGGVIRFFFLLFFTHHGSVDIISLWMNVILNS